MINFDNIIIEKHKRTLSKSAPNYRSSIQIVNAGSGPEKTNIFLNLISHVLRCA